MTDSRRDARLCLALTMVFTAVGLYFAVQPSWWCAPAFYIAVLLGWCERRLTADHRRRLRGRHTTPPRCCSFWTHSDGEIHGPDCTRLSDGSKS